jgi:CRISPR-associated exonuclease Cas4
MDEDGFVMLSALQHFVFCPRQCALIHVEQTFEDNLFTVRGHQIHQRVDEPTSEVLEDGLRVERKLSLRSTKYKLYGTADAVEFSADHPPYPIEYKSGPKKSKLADEIQLAAQAICLEEMFGQPITLGAIFHHASRRRREVKITEQLKQQVLETADKVRSLFTTSQLPKAVHDRRCQDCSLREICLPEITDPHQKKYQWHKIFEIDVSSESNAEE